MNIQRSKLTNGSIAVVIGAIILIIGVVFFAITRAGTNYAALEPEDGTITAPATITNDSEASGGRAINFVPAATAPNPGGSNSYKKLSPGTAWQWQISGTINETILDTIAGTKKMYDIDMFNSDSAIISRLKAKGITVVCYMEVGSWENYRSDAAVYPASVLGKTLNGYPDEKYLDIRSQTVKDAIVKRLDMAKNKGCEGIEPDIDDAYFEDFNGSYSKVSSFTGFPISYTDQVNFNIYLANAAHARGMSYGLKNGADEKYVADLLPHIDWVLNEQCYQYKECEVYKPVIAAGKAVFQVEYSSDPAKYCASTNALNFDSLKKAVALDALPRTACR